MGDVIELHVGSENAVQYTTQRSRQRKKEDRSRNFMIDHTASIKTYRFYGRFHATRDSGRALGVLGKELPTGIARGACFVELRRRMNVPEMRACLAGGNVFDCDSVRPTYFVLSSFFSGTYE